MVTITVKHNNGEEFILHIRYKSFPVYGGFYVSNDYGLMLKDGFETVQDAVKWAIEVLPNAFE